MLTIYGVSIILCFIKILYGSRNFYTDFSWSTLPSTSTNAETDLKIEQNIETGYLRNREVILVGDLNVNYLDEKHIQSIGLLSL